MDLRWLAVLAFAGTLPAGAAPESFVVDGSHSAPSFTISHSGISFVRGLFRKTSGKITLDRGIFTRGGATDTLDREAKSGVIDVRSRPPVVHFRGGLYPANEKEM